MGYLLTQLARLAETSITAVGTHLVVTVSGIFFLGIPAMLSVGAYGMVIPQQYGLSFAVSLLISFLLSFSVGMIFVILYFKLSRDSFMVFTFTSLLAIEAIIKSWDKVTGGVLGIAGVARPEFALTLVRLVTLQVILMLVVFLFEYIVLRSWLGRFLLGIKENENLVESLQVSAKRLGAFAILVSALLAAMQGILSVWRIQFLDASFGTVLVLVQYLTIAIIAAKPKVRWLFGSILFVIFLPEVLRFLDLPSAILGPMRNLIYSVLLIIVLLRINQKHLAHKRAV